MRFLILSDIHANWHALQSVLDDARDTYDEIVCCGDLVGYNPHPGKVIAWARQHCSAVIRGNHDKVVAGIDDLEWFNEVAQAAARWTMAHVSPEELAYLRDLPQGPMKRELFHMWHGALSDEDEYVSSPRDAGLHFSQFELPLAFFGHTHLQGGFFFKNGRAGSLPRVSFDDAERVIELGPPSTLYMVNPGSVGQPRDGDPRASYAVFDSEKRTVTLRRTEYPIEKTVADIQEAGLPNVLGIRLFHGV